MALLAWPVLLSLIAEPLAGLADTAFVSRLGAPELAALGISTTLLSGVFWVFGFLGIAAQTRVARAWGGDRLPEARDSATLVLALALAIGVAAALLSLPFLGPGARAMGGSGPIEGATIRYLGIRLVGLPGSLIMTAGFGVLRGLQDMRTPLWAAGTASLLNALLDPILIFGAGPIPGLGVAGAAAATSATQWLAALWALRAVGRRLGPARRVPVRGAVRLLVVGRDLFLRTGLLLAFLFVATRQANLAGAESGAAHHAIRQIWITTALLLDAYAAVAQSLVGYFLGAGAIATARRVAGVACLWALGTGAVLTVGMLAGGEGVAHLLVPPEARLPFAQAWWIAAAAQPVNALSFVTDGIHWGTDDYRYLRNGMAIASGLGIAALLAVDPGRAEPLSVIWAVTAAWTGVRSVVGLVRVWPAPAGSPLRVPRR